MATKTYNFEVTQEVFYMNIDQGVLDAIVKSVNIAISQTTTAITYDIAFKKSTKGSATVPESSLYFDVDSALAAYRNTVIVL